MGLYSRYECHTFTTCSFPILFEVWDALCGKKTIHSTIKYCFRSTNSYIGSPRVSSTPSGLVSVTVMILWVFGGEKTIWSTNEPLWKRFWGCLTKGSKIDFQFNFSMDCFPLPGFGVQGSWNYGVGSYLGPIIRVGVPWGTLPRVPKFISNLILHWNYSCRSLAMGGSWN